MTLLFFSILQRSACHLQYTHGLLHDIHNYMELWYRGDGVYTLEGTIALTAGLSHHDISSDGVSLYQIPPGVDFMDHIGSYSYLW